MIYLLLFIRNTLEKYFYFIFQPVLLFAGEHTHSNFYSTAHGAYMSGQAAGRRLLTSEEPEENFLECSGSADLHSWIQGTQLEG